MNFKGAYALYSVAGQNRIQSFSTTSSDNKEQKVDTITTHATGRISNPGKTKQNKTQDETKQRFK